MTKAANKGRGGGFFFFLVKHEWKVEWAATKVLRSTMTTMSDKMVTLIPHMTDT